MTKSQSNHNFIELLKSHNIDQKLIKIIVNQIQDLAIVGEDVKHITGFDDLPIEVQSAICQQYDYLHEQYTRDITN